MPVNDVSTPRTFKCPISGQTFVDPVLEADGYTYDRAALEASHKTIAASSRPQALLRTPNTTLARALREFQEQRHGPPELRDAWKRNVECPITYNVMRMPLQLTDGHDYDLHSAVTLVNFHGRSSFTNLAFTDAEKGRANRTLAALAREVFPGPAAIYEGNAIEVGWRLPTDPGEAPPATAQERACAEEALNSYSAGGPVQPLEGAARAHLVHLLRQRMAADSRSLLMRAHELIALEDEHLGLGVVVDGFFSLASPHCLTLAAAAVDARQIDKDRELHNANAPVDERIESFCAEAHRFIDPRLKAAVMFLWPMRALTYAVAVGIAAGTTMLDGLGNRALFAVMAGSFSAISCELFFRFALWIALRPPVRFRGREASAALWSWVHSLPFRDTRAALLVVAVLAADIITSRIIKKSIAWSIGQLSMPSVS